MKIIHPIKITLDFLLDNHFPELKDDVKTSVNFEENDILIHVKKGLLDPTFQSALPALIFRKSFFENCKHFGVKNLVFVDETNQTFDLIEIDNFDISKLR
jgi:hypothetical protein